jgi:anaerobic selenocysteine-containing dehydrogenase
LIRTSKDGVDSFREADWDEALDYIAQRMKEIAAKHGPECAALFTHGSGGAHFGQMLKAFGSHLLQLLHLRNVGVREKLDFSRPSVILSIHQRELISVILAVWF